jgi:ketosteroid isomerase-like protein
MTHHEQTLSEDDAAHSENTAEIIRRFNTAFLEHDPALLDDLVAEDCVIENTVPAPDGARHIGRDACLKLWQGIASETGTHFDLEDVFAAGDRAIIRWRYRWGEQEGESVRGVNLMRVRGDLIVEAMGYVKGR